MTTMSIQGVSLFVKVIGHGYPLVLMHGGPGLDHTTLLDLQPLADRFTLIFYDHRCNGRSTGPDISSMTFENLTIEREVYPNFVVRAGYAGSKGTALLQGQQLNPAVYIPGQSTLANTNNRRPYWPAFTR